MGLAMAAPYRHPKTGIFWFRRRIPADLVSSRDRLIALGVKTPSHLKISLRTRDPQEAKRRCHEADQAWEKTWADWRALLRDGPRNLSQKEIFALSATIARRVTEHFGENPGDLDRRQRMEHHLAGIADHPRPDQLTLVELALKEIVPKLGITAVAPQSMRGLVRQFLKDAPLVAGNLAAMASGDYSEAEWLAKRPTIAQPSSSITIESLIVGWQNEMPPDKRNEETERTYRYRIADFRSGLDHDNAARITAEDVMAWHDRMLAAHGPERLSNRAINGKLQALSTLLAWGVRKRKLSVNVAVGIRVRTDGQGSKKRGFTLEEMRTILKAARTMNKPSDAVKRWAPWVMAYSGARIGEVCRLRCKDVSRDSNGQWIMTFTRAAGSLKTESSERTIPMHLALVAEGFPDYVEATAKELKGRGSGGGGRVFPFLYLAESTNSPQAIARRGRSRTDKWIFGEAGRKGKNARPGLLRPDPALSPNHGWRHAFKTMCREHGVDQECRDAIEGHSTNGVAPNYGVWTVAAMRRQLEKIPRILADK
jgi:integrase